MALQMRCLSALAADSGRLSGLGGRFGGSSGLVCGCGFGGSGLFRGLFGGGFCGSLRDHSLLFRSKHTGGALEQFNFSCNIRFYLRSGVAVASSAFCFFNWLMFCLAVDIALASIEIFLPL